MSMYMLQRRAVTPNSLSKSPQSDSKGIDLLLFYIYIKHTFNLTEIHISILNLNLISNKKQDRGNHLELSDEILDFKSQLVAAGNQLAVFVSLVHVKIYLMTGLILERKILKLDVKLGRNLQNLRAN
ncbi:hypothetical protein GQR58_019362 [Nymphon striatum]|nr:hypothetical protein GQR58_019362 [Nymphon striatum]